jgi:hypothetical protein
VNDALLSAPFIVSSFGEISSSKHDRLGDGFVACANEVSRVEVERAIDNMLKSGKLFAMAGRRDSMPIMGGARSYADYGAHSFLLTPKPGRAFQLSNIVQRLPDPRLTGSMVQRHHSVSEYDPLRPHPGVNLQNYYAHQRFPPRPSEAEQMLQQKRRMAAQRERELRNYHQEQQYNRSVSGSG